MILSPLKKMFDVFDIHFILLEDQKLTNEKFLCWLICVHNHLKDI
jgi:hypothetical protein